METLVEQFEVRLGNTQLREGNRHVQHVVEPRLELQGTCHGYALLFVNRPGVRIVDVGIGGEIWLDAKHTHGELCHLVGMHIGHILQEGWEDDGKTGTMRHIVFGRDLVLHGMAVPILLTPQ